MSSLNQCEIIDTLRLRVPLIGLSKKGYSVPKIQVVTDD